MSRLFHGKYWQAPPAFFFGVGVTMALSKHFVLAYFFFSLLTIWIEGSWLTSDLLLERRRESERAPRRRKRLTPQVLIKIKKRKRQKYLVTKFGTAIFLLLIGVACLIVTRNWQNVWELQQNTGFLVPANDPMPQVCQQEEVPSGETRIYAGGGMSVVNPNVPYSLISIAGHKLLWVTTSRDGISISGRIYDSDGALAILTNNHFKTSRNLGFKPERPDRHTLIVYNKWDRTAFSIRFLNPEAVKVGGTFFYPGYPPVIIDNDSIKIGHVTMQGNCNFSPHFPGAISIE